ncbi:MAG TPA: ATP-dependent DNA helicase RecG [Microbacteriaceae bacterium]|nr:ATP-dependent DNA helicase RecG [Microbacteriaceae bacterium]
MGTPGRASPTPGETPAPAGPRSSAGAGLRDPLRGIIGGRSAGSLHKAFGFETVRDLVTHYPRRYASRGELSPLAALTEGEAVTVVAEVQGVRERPMRARRGTILDVRLSDGRGSLALTFFNQPWRANELRPGVRGMFAGKVSLYRGQLQLAHPDYELFDEAEGQPSETEARRWATTPIPVYAATAAIASWRIQRAVGVVLDALGELDDPVPEEIRRRHGMPGYREALEMVHRPTSDAQWRRAREALRRIEALVLQTALLERRSESEASSSVARSAAKGGLREKFDARLPYALTADQSAVGAEIEADLARPHPMSRLLQGDVGSGKTLVAVRAMLVAAESGGQCALVVPTEVLAGQHLRSIVRLLGPDLAALLEPTLVTGALSARERRTALVRIASGRARIVIGTHALFGDAVVFDDLALVVIDEQHRFGVEQRDVLRTKGRRAPHTLVMTATPIPRTIAMTVFGDLDVSTLRTMPPGRRPVQTIAVPLAEHPRWEERIWARSAEEVAAGRQVFLVCPAIDAEPAPGGRPDDDVPDDPDHGAPPPGRATLQAGIPLLPEGEEAPGVPRSSVEQVAATARSRAELAGARIGVLHGRLPAEEKNSVMEAFAAGTIDVLVSTTVIEVGVDVPNASLMVIFDADRFGLSQLHQLRGRVGRGGAAGLCLLVTRALAETPGRLRVDAVAANADGFELARIDLELRREGDVLGADQSGRRSSLRLLRVTRDGDLIAEARADAARLLAAPGGLAAHPALGAALQDRLDDIERDFLARN